MNVTQEVRNNHIIYGASDHTAPGSIAASKSLNYAKGPTITRPDRQLCTAVPRTLRYEGETGLFGTENYFTRVQLEIIGDAVFACYEEDGWECATASLDVILDPFYTEADVDRNADNTVVNTFDPASVKGNSLPYIPGGGYLSVDLERSATGNKYVDDWLDVRLYTQDREEHPSDRMYVKPTDAFYIGFHARNTRRLQYNVACIIGLQYVGYDSIEDKQLIMRKPYN